MVNAARFDLSNPHVVLRIVCGLAFVPHVMSKLLPPHGPLEFFSAFAPSAPYAVMYLAAAAEVVACVGLIFAVATRWAALLAAAILVVVVYALVSVGGAKHPRIWTLGGIEYPVFWGLICLVLAWLYWGDGHPSTTRSG